MTMTAEFQNILSRITRSVGNNRCLNRIWLSESRTDWLGCRSSIAISTPFSWRREAVYFWETCLLFLALLSPGFFDNLRGETKTNVQHKSRCLEPSCIRSAFHIKSEVILIHQHVWRRIVGGLKAGCPGH